MEKFPSSEKKEISDQELIEALKTRGVEDSEAFQLLQEWTQQEEKKVTTPEQTIELNRKRGKLYAEAGYIDEALDALEGARTQAWNENRVDLYDAIEAKMNELENSHES